MNRIVLPCLLAALAVTPAAAQADFEPPIQLAASTSGMSVAVAGDADGAVTAVTSGDGSRRVLARAPDGPWPNPMVLPGEPRGVAGPAVAAAGHGALAIAWRVDTPRAYAGIQAAVRDPGDTLGPPLTIAGADAHGARHPAVAVDAAGGTLVAYNTNTRESHLNRRGAIAIAYRPRGGTFAPPRIVDAQDSGAPVVALSAGGDGVVAWSRDRRVFAARVAPGGTVGAPKEVATVRGLGALTAAAGPRGEATLAWTQRSFDTRTHAVVRAARLTRNGVGKAQTVRSAVDRYVNGVALATDEQGRTALAWAEDDFGHPQDVGARGFVTAVRLATAAPSRGFGAARLVVRGGHAGRASLSLAAANGRVALAWGYVASRREMGIQAVSGRPTALGAPQVVARSFLDGRFFMVIPAARIALAPSGRATVFGVLSRQPTANQLVQVLVGAEG